MSFGKKYYLGINVTAGHITEALTQEELLPKNYDFQTCNNLESLNTQVGILENQDTYCGAIVKINEISFPLEYEYRSQISKLNPDDIFVLLIEK
jgi:hypothetical protein